MATPRRVLNHLVPCVFSLCMALSYGCSATIPTTPHGVLSTIHQKTLALAAERAMVQAGVTTGSYGKQKVFLEQAKIADTDLGKQHAARVVRDHIRKAAAGMAETAKDADRSLHVELLAAGVDVKMGRFFGFSWLETTAEVTARVIAATSGEPPVEKDGNGTSVFKQTWWLGIGPTEKLKKLSQNTQSPVPE